jgi:hypothetical protein
MLQIVPICQNFDACSGETLIPQEAVVSGCLRDKGYLLLTGTLGLKGRLL